MGSQNFFYITTVSAFFALFATIFQGYFSSSELQHLTMVLSSLTDLEFSNRSLPLAAPKVAVGYGACTDVYVHAVQLLNASELDESVPWKASDKITTREELLQSFGYFFQKGAAAERLIENKGLFNDFLRSAQRKNVLIRKAIGLNAPGMANRFALDGATVLLGADLSVDQKAALHKNIQLSNGITTEEDIHLILEYKADAEWGKLKAPRANRFIVRTDEYNPILSSLDPIFTGSFAEFEPRLFAISGLHVMDNDPAQIAIREEKLTSLANQLRILPQSTLIHFEMASYVETAYLKDIFRTIVPHTNSLGMNEQELQNLDQVFTKNEISLVADFNPTVSKTWDKTRQVYKHIYREFMQSGSRPLTRIHVHTLAYQLIMTVRGSDWKNSRSAAAKSALTAHRYVCGTDFVNPESAQLLLDGSFDIFDESGQRTTLKVTEKNPVQCWDESLTIESSKTAGGGDPPTTNRLIEVEVCVAPVLVCKSAKWTTGAGDNISAAGLIVQI